MFKFFELGAAVRGVFRLFVGSPTALEPRFCDVTGTLSRSLLRSRGHVDVLKCSLPIGAVGSSGLGLPGGPASGAVVPVDV